MTIRVRDQLTDFDTERLAAAITTAVLNPDRDDVPHKAKQKVGTGWVRWSDLLARPKNDPRLD